MTRETRGRAVPGEVEGRGAAGRARRRWRVVPLSLALVGLAGGEAVGQVPDAEAAAAARATPTLQVRNETGRDVAVSVAVLANAGKVPVGAVGAGEEGDERAGIPLSAPGVEPETRVAVRVKRGRREVEVLLVADGWRDGACERTTGRLPRDEREAADWPCDHLGTVSLLAVADLELVATETGGQLFVTGPSEEGPTVADDGVAVALRSGGEGGRPVVLLRAVPGRPGARIDAVRLDLPENLAASARPVGLPEGWTSDRAGGELALSGPPTSLPLVLRIELEGATRAPSLVNLRLVADGRLVYAGSGLRVAALAPAAPVTELTDALLLPALLHPGETVVLRPLDPARTPRGGTWTVAGVTAREAPEPSESAGSSGGAVRYELELPADLAPGTPISVTYTDPWGERLVEVAAAPDVEVRPLPEPLPASPRLLGATPKAFGDKNFCVWGWFPSEEAAAGLALDGESLGGPLTYGRTVLWFSVPPGAAPGEHAVTGDPGAGYPADDAATLRVLALGGSIDQERLWRGQSTPLRLWIEGTDEPVTLELTNDTPDVVSLDRGERQVVTTSGGSPNQVERTVHAVQRGDFNITFKMETDACPAELP